LFGYITPLKSELKVREYEVFKAYYCSLCKELGRRYGKHAQFLIQYDCAFLALLLDATREEEPGFYKSCCAYNPLKAKMVARHNDAICYAADVNMLLAYYKIKDDYCDEKSLKTLAAMIFFGRAGKRAARRQPKIAGVIREKVAKLSELEKQDCENIDAAADCTASMLGAVFRYFFDSTAMEALGYDIGRWVYLIDACDDMQRDLAQGNYNVFLRRYGNEALEGQKQREEIAFALQFSLARATENFNKLEIYRNRGILENILYAGVLQKTNGILQRQEEGVQE
jgi:hypothetical protein